MTGLVFVDTNVLVYARDANEAEKQPLAATWLAHLWRQKLGRLSFQVLHEFYVTVTERLQPGMKREAARSDVLQLLAWRPVVLDRGVLESAWMIQDRYKQSWWDSLIIAAAQASGSRYLLSEDFQDQQRFDDVTVIDPFRHPPESLD